MKGIAGRAMRGLPAGARLDCIDNTGAKIVEIVIISVKKGAADMRRQLLRAVIVRQRRPFRRPDGTMVQFEDNAAVIVAENGDTKGSMIKGPVALEAAERWPRIASTASIIV